jgi:hypothetical protein
MGTRVDAALLWSRALCVGVLAFVLGVAGHVMADGLLPGPTLLVALGALSVLVSAPLLSRPASGVRLAGLLVAGQTAIHVALTATAGHRGDPVTATPAPRAQALLPVVDGRRVGSLQDAYQAGQPPMSIQLPTGHLVADLQAHAPMMAAHLAVAALVGLWLAYGERALWTLVALLGRRLLLAWRPVAVEPRPAPTPAWRALPPARSHTRDPHPHRGPPLLAV